jgi:hypothetical protein
MDGVEAPHPRINRGSVAAATSATNGHEVEESPTTNKITPMISRTCRVATSRPKDDGEQCPRTTILASI